MIRPAKQCDQAALYDIVVRTGLCGADASAQFKDPQMLGHVFTSPYVALAPELAFVVEMNGQVSGYVCGVADSRAFEARMRVDWWPDLRTRYADPDLTHRDRWSEDEIWSHWIHHPKPIPAYVADPFPAHMHMNLMPAVRGGGMGRRLFDTWMAAARRQGVGPVHIGANPDNVGGIAFWHAMGFERLRDGEGHFESETYWMGRP